MVIAHNLAAMNAYRMLNITDSKRATSTQRLSSGYKINRAADDAAGLSISEKMRHQIRGLNQGAQNIQEGVGYCQVADGALEEIQQMLHRITELSIKASNDTLSSDDRSAVNEEIQALKTEMTRICETTKFNEELIFVGDDYASGEPYELDFSGILRDIYVYNDSFSDAGATYGGIAYEGVRYAWDSIDPNMYNKDTNTFNEGRYTLKMADGLSVTLVCENGNKPPQISREFTTNADTNGIYINDKLISWDDVKTAAGASFNPDNILQQSYNFEYGGITMSFTPRELNTFEDVIDRLSNIKLTSTYNIPTEETAVFADFNKSTSTFTSNADVESFLNNNSFTKYTLYANENGIGLKDKSGNLVSNSLKTWASIGIENWGDESDDIWSDKTYNYSSNGINISFSLVNEASMDSVIKAFDGVEIKTTGEINTYGFAGVTIDGTKTNNLLSAKISNDKIDITLQEEYSLGRNFSSYEYSWKDSDICYEDNRFSVTYEGIDGFEKTYSNNADVLADKISGEITKNIEEYLKIVKLRYLAGAENPTDLNLTSAMGTDKVTGNGSSTSFTEVYPFDEDDGNLKNTLFDNSTQAYGAAKYIGVEIDFSGLGNTDGTVESYTLADLIGTGFDSICATCDNHYSIQFTVPAATDTTWTEIKIGENTFKYSKKQTGDDYVLYVDLESMEANNITTGKEFTNVLVDILNASKYDFHFTQYATTADGSKLYVFDNRTSYVDENGNAKANNAEFEPQSYSLNGISEFDLTLYDENDSNESVTFKFEYDWNELIEFDNLIITEVQDDTNGLYIKNDEGLYELYDASKHLGKERFNITDISINTNSESLRAYIDNYVENQIFGEISNAVNMQLKGSRPVYSITGVANENAAMITTFSKPVQKEAEASDIKDKAAYLKIQCSSNVIDNIQIKKHILTLNRMGISNLNSLTREDAIKAIDQVDFALRKVSSIRGAFGAYQNRLEHAYAQNLNVAENTTAAESQIRDTDMAAEMVKFSNANILAQAGQAMLAQANQMNQGVLSLLS